MEFLLVFPPVLTLFLCMMQLVFLHSASLGVKFAAGRAARAAAVVIPDKSSAYDGAPAYQLLGDTSCPKNTAQKMTDVLTKIGFKAPSSGSSSCRGGPRASAIRSAAVMSMLPFGSTLDSFVSQNSGSSNIATWLASALGYGLGATSVTFPLEPLSDAIRKPGDHFPDDQDALVRVTHLFHCQVPIARHVMCHGRWGLIQQMLIKGIKKTDESHQGLKELRAGVAKSTLLKLFIASNERFRVIRHESSFPMQGAAYSE